MLRSSGQAQTRSDQIVANAASLKRRQGDKTEETKSRLPAVITIVGALAVLAWWKRRGKRDFNGEAGNSSAPSRGQARGKLSGGRLGKLPRNASSNNKKNKDRRKAERERRADKRGQEATGSGPSSSGKHNEEGDNSIILTSTFVDPHKSSTTNAPRVQKREGPTATSETKKGNALDPAFVTELKRKS